jgi:thiamine biosynthesis protein ThiS
MLLQINGEEREFADGLTVAALVAQLGMKADRVAVELNLEILPRTAWDSTALKSGDKLEVVHFVGGGAGRGSSHDFETQPIVETGHAGTTPEPWKCATCGASGSGMYCPACGEKRPSQHDLSLHHFFTHALGEFFHFDSKIFRTFRLLLTRPGFLATEYIRGCRKPYLHPFQVFFIANLIYFILQPIIGWSGLRTWLYIQMHMMPYSQLASRMVADRLLAKATTLKEFTAAFDHAVDVQARTLVIVMVPLLALLLALVQWRKRRFFGEHMLFALHFTAFWLIGMFVLLYGGSVIVLKWLAHYGIHFPDTKVDAFLFPITRAVQAIYLYLAFRVFYHDSVLAAALRAAGVAYLLLYIMQLYRFVLFLTALYTA